MNSSYLQKPQDVERKWYVVDAADKPLGRVAATVASILLCFLLIVNTFWKIFNKSNNNLLFSLYFSLILFKSQLSF